MDNKICGNRSAGIGVSYTGRRATLVGFLALQRAGTFAKLAIGDLGCSNDRVHDIPHS
jgi:hypothetical protein